MKKKYSKKIIPLSLTSILLYLVFTVVIAFFIFCVIFFVISDDLKTSYKLFAIIATVSLSLLFTINLYFFLKKKIIFNPTELYVPADHKGIITFRRLQHETLIKYSDIIEIHLSLSSCDSIGLPVSGVFINMIYLNFTLKEGKEQAINLYYYSKHQLINIIDEIGKRMCLNGNELKIDSGELMLSKFIKEQNIKTKLH